MLILAYDGNFRLKHRLIKNAKDDQPLGNGWGYFVENRKYGGHLKNYVTEEDVC
jgi:hypothetical protein